MAENLNEATLEVTREKLTFHRSDGTATEISLIALLDGPDADAAGLEWAQMMQQKGIMEFQLTMAKTFAVMLEIQKAQLELLQGMAQGGATATDPAEAIKGVFKAMGIPEDKLQEAMKLAFGGIAEGGGGNGVSMKVTEETA